MIDQAWTASQPSILLVDDDAQVREMLFEYLSGHGFHVSPAEDARAARALLAMHAPDLVLLDLTMPGEDGLSLARHLREHFDVGIIMVTASTSVVDRIVGLEIGADDYVAKPFDPRELLARIKSVLRRVRARKAPAGAAGAAATQRVRVGACELDLDTHRLFAADGSEIPLTHMEFDLLRVFATRPNRVLSRDDILNLTQNRDWDPFDRSVDIRIARLRRKVEPDPAQPRVIRTVRGAGYMFVPD